MATIDPSMTTIEASMTTIDSSMTPFESSMTTIEASMAPFESSMELSPTARGSLQRSRGTNPMTQQIARAVETHLEARGVGVIVIAHHLCIGCRGVKLPATQLVTSAMLGQLRTDADTRSEFLRLCGGGTA
jgi:hypothetical protein